MQSDSSSARNSSDKFGQSNLNRAVEEFLKSGKSELTTADIEKMRSKYGASMASMFAKQARRGLEKTKKKVNQFVDLLMRKYGSRLGADLPHAKFLRKAKKQATQYGISDAEFRMAEEMIQERMAGTPESFPGVTEVYPQTKLSSFFGSVDGKDMEKLTVPEKDYSVLQEIIRSYNDNKALHSRVMVQSLTYRDMAPEAMAGSFHRGRTDPTNYVHAVVAALFLPKIKLLDEHMLFASLAHIIKTRSEGDSPKTAPEYEVYRDLIVDPFDELCDDDSPVRDMLGRVQLQHKLWEHVLALRNGQYYGVDLSQFLNAVENCRVNMYDSPDLMYTKDEGAIFRRLIGAFSLRPTMVVSFPVYGGMGGMGMGQPGMPGMPGYGMGMPGQPGYGMGMPGHMGGKATRVSMVNYRLSPLGMHVTPGMYGQQQQDNNLKNVINDPSPQWTIKKGSMALVNQAVQYSWDVLFVHVNRRFQHVNMGQMQQPYYFARLPLQISGFEALNTTAVNYDNEYTIGPDSFELRSVVISQTAPERSDLIIGSSALIRLSGDEMSGRQEDQYHYNPQLAALTDVEGTSLKSNTPISWIPDKEAMGLQATAVTGTSFYSRASTRGTIFVYAKRMQRDQMMAQGYGYGAGYGMGQGYCPPGVMPGVGGMGMGGMPGMGMPGYGRGF